jgi:hypothetical protein
MKFSLKTRLAQVIVMAVLFISPLVGMSQVGPGGLPEDAVPFDDNMNLVFLAAGIVFAVVVSIRYFRKKTTATA